jgi:hypothetical protein
MSLGLSESRNRRKRRRQVVVGLVQSGLVIAVALGVGFWARDIGTEIARRDVATLETRLSDVTSEAATLRSEIVGLKAALRAEKDRVAEWRERYEKDVPSTAEAEILAAARARIAGGVPVARLASVVAMAHDDVECTPLGEPKRFIVNNEIRSGAKDSVSFASGAVTVMASGVAARNAAGQPEAWFDTAKPVTVTFSHVGGESSQVEGLLPIHHAIAVGQIEYRFSMVAGARSFVEVTGATCSFP